MSTFVAQDHRRLPVVRQDLSYVAQRWQGGRYWTVKDAVRLRYFQLREEEYFVLQLLDGQHTLDEIVAQFEERFAPRKVRMSELSAFVAMLHREGLTVASAYGQGEHLLARRSQRLQREWLGQALNVLAIKFPGVNPDRWLAKLVASIRWLVTPALAISCLLLVAAAALLLTLDVQKLVARLPRLHELVGWGNLTTMFVALMIVKTLHELGHAIACKYFGGQCHHLGVMLLFFTPALYCDVSDAWMFPERWKRIVVSAAGMAVELVLAAMAIILWAFTQPGWLNTLLFNVFVVCSIGTLLINANPLLRYDGYFLFADWLGIPNLREQAQSELRRWWARLAMGVELPPSPALVPASPLLLLSYGVLSAIYRWLMIGGALWLLYAALEPHGLAIVAQLMAAPVIASQLISPFTQAARFLGDPMQRQRIDRWRLTVTCLILASCTALVMALPMPRRVTAPLLLQSAGVRQIYVATPGILEYALPAGSGVRAKQEVARLRNLELELEVSELIQRVDQQRLLIEQWEIRRHEDPALGDALPVAQQTLSDLVEQLAQKRHQQAELILTAPIAGTLLPPTQRASVAETDELSTYVGTPLDLDNRGCYLEAGTWIGSIGSPGGVEALAIVHESELPLLAVGQSARLALTEAAGEILTGHVANIAPLNARDVPEVLWATGAFPAERQANGRRQLQSNYYQVVITIDPHTAPLLAGGLGHTKIRVAPETLGWRAYRALRGVLRWPY